MDGNGLQHICRSVVEQVERAVIGRRHTIETIIKAFICGGHVLLEDVPGVGKTMLVRAISQAMDVSFRRIQFTADLFPADITGTSIYQADKGTFEFKQGPLFTPILLADEINRAPAKTQSALLEAMEERKVTIDGQTYDLPDPFLVLATQNPIEYEGTHRLPEAQLDRFLFRIQLGYPTIDQEIDILEYVREKNPLEQIKPVMTIEQLKQMQHDVRSIFVDPSIKRYIVQLSEATRKHPQIRLGASPRASVALMRAAQSEAWFDGREFVIPDDVKHMIGFVYGHRLVIDDYMMEEQTAEGLLREVIKTVEVPAFRRFSA